MSTVESELELQRVLSGFFQQRAQVRSCLADLQKIVSRDLCTNQGMWSVTPYGSAVNGYSTSASDLDVVVHSVDTSGETKPILIELTSILQDSKLFRVEAQILGARVPILKVLYHGMEVDLSVNNMRPLLNTRLLKAYASLDKRVAQLGVVVKLWANSTNICGSSKGHLSSYAFVLMSIYFLQVSDTRLPCLQQGGMLDNIFEKDDEIETQVREESADGWALDEDLSLYTLVCKFFEFYTQDFKWGSEVVSIRLARRLNADAEEFNLLARHNDCGDKCPRIDIEDPFDRSRNLSDVLRSKQRLMDSFASGHRALQEGQFIDVCVSGNGNK